MALKHFVTHVGIGLDASFSMEHLASTVVKVVDAQIKHWAEQSRELNQEVRVSVYSFGSRDTVKCLVWDMDVLRFDTIQGLYKVGGRTALLDCTHTMLDDFATIPVKYDDHAHVLYLWTDGQENDSRQFQPHVLSSKIAKQPDNVTVAAFVPDEQGKKYAVNCGFPADNIQVWDATSPKGIEEVAKVIRDTSTTFMQGRASGVRSYKSGFFTLNKLTPADITKNLRVIPSSHYRMLSYNGTGTIWIRDFVEEQLNRGVPSFSASYFHYTKGCAYYEFRKTEHIQENKDIAVLYNNKVYSGTEARTMLNLPATGTVKVTPEQYPDYVLFVQSGSVNRHIIPGQRVLVMTGNINRSPGYGY
jgi:hypothetical protein